MELTRDQVLALRERLVIAVDASELKGLVNDLAINDAALRLRYENAEQKYKDVLSGWDASYVGGLEVQVADLTAKLAAITRERDRLKMEILVQFDDLTFQSARANSTELQLATAQATVTAQHEEIGRLRGEKNKS